MRILVIGVGNDGASAVKHMAKERKHWSSDISQDIGLVCITEEDDSSAAELPMIPWKTQALEGLIHITHGKGYLEPNWHKRLDDHMLGRTIKDMLSIPQNRRRALDVLLIGSPVEAGLERTCEPILKTIHNLRYELCFPMRIFFLACWPSGLVDVNWPILQLLGDLNQETCAAGQQAICSGVWIFPSSDASEPGSEDYVGSLVVFVESALRLGLNKVVHEPLKGCDHFAVHQYKRLPGNGADVDADEDEDAESNRENPNLVWFIRARRYRFSIKAMERRACDNTFLRIKTLLVDRPGEGMPPPPLTEGENLIESKVFAPLDQAVEKWSQSGLRMVESALAQLERTIPLDSANVEIEPNWTTNNILNPLVEQLKDLVAVEIPTLLAEIERSQGVLSKARGDWKTWLTQVLAPPGEGRLPFPLPDIRAGIRARAEHLQTHRHVEPGPSSPLDDTSFYQNAESRFSRVKERFQRGREKLQATPAAKFAGKWVPLWAGILAALVAIVWQMGFKQMPIPQGPSPWPLLSSNAYAGLYVFVEKISSPPICLAFSFVFFYFIGSAFRGWLRKRTWERAMKFIHGEQGSVASAARHFLEDNLVPLAHQKKKEQLTGYMEKLKVMLATELERVNRELTMIEDIVRFHSEKIATSLGARIPGKRLPETAEERLRPWDWSTNWDTSFATVQDFHTMVHQRFGEKVDTVARLVMHSHDFPLRKWIRNVAAEQPGHQRDIFKASHGDPWPFLQLEHLFAVIHENLIGSQNPLQPAPEREDELIEQFKDKVVAMRAAEKNIFFERHLTSRFLFFGKKLEPYLRRTLGWSNARYKDALEDFELIGIEETDEGAPLAHLQRVLHGAGLDDQEPGHA
ncbi:MAG: hypothetical protein P9L99_11105 [Candidatus Lernaella stagnicola]|nr:hypothetical protein [Candidatus Lernaella stagnicola]